MEFRSFTAPALESSYIPNAKLEEDDPGFSILQNYYDVFELELCYYTFIDLAGKKEPIKMILPSNMDTEGYDGIIYLVCFGKVEDAEHSTYVAMDKTTSSFIDYATEIEGIDEITVKHESLINSAVAALNAMKQDYTNFGYTEERWQEMSDAVKKAKAELNSIKLQSASPALQKLQADILALPDTYTSADKATMDAIKASLALLKPAEKVILDLSRYTALLPAYEADVPDVIVPDDPTPDPEPNKPASPLTTVLIVLVSVMAIATVAAVAYVIIKRKNKSKKAEKPEQNEAEDSVAKDESVLQEENEAQNEPVLQDGPEEKYESEALENSEKGDDEE